MNKVNFYNLMTLDAKSLNEMENNIIEELRELKNSSTGEVSFGLNSVLEGQKLTVSAGFGFSSNGNLETLESDSELILQTENNEHYLIYLLNSKLNYSQLLNEPKDPYELKIVKSDNVLAFGIIISGEYYSLNRAEDQTDLPVGTVLLYLKDNKFKDYYSIKGFKKLNLDSQGKFLMFSQKSDSFGGSNEIMLTKSNLPSFEVKGKTEISGEHTHNYVSFKSFGGSPGFGAAWRGSTERTVSNSGSHSHSLTLNFENENQKALFTTPKSVTVLPIIKVY